MHLIKLDKKMTACELIEFLAKNVAQLDDMPVHIAYGDSDKLTVIDDITFSVNIDIHGDSVIILKEKRRWD